MDKKFQCCFPGETWRLLWLMGLIFAVITIFQHVELQYGIMLLSISYSPKDLVAGNSTRSLTNGIVPALPQLTSPPNTTLPKNVESNSITSVALVGSNTSALPKDAAISLASNRSSKELQNNLTPLHNKSSVTSVRRVKNMHEKPISIVISIAEMNNLLLKSRSSPNSMVCIELLL